MNTLRDLLDTHPSKWLIPDILSDEETYRIADYVQSVGNDSMCFYVGDPCALDGRSGKIGMCQLPYERCWFEFAFDSNGVMVTVGALVAKEEERTVIVGFSKKKGRWGFRYVAYCDSIDALKLAVQPNLDLCLNEALIVRNRIAAILSAINCTNVRRVEHKPSALKQQMRARKGKPPLFSYWTLELDLTRPESHESLGGTHASPRVHLRRGHARQYAPGKWTWVQPCTVGDKSKGMVHKDYAVKVH